jgi:chromosome segregation ATPase
MEMESMMQVAGYAASMAASVWVFASKLQAGVSKIDAHLAVIEERLTNIQREVESAKDSRRDLWQELHGHGDRLTRIEAHK